MALPPAFVPPFWFRTAAAAGPRRDLRAGFAVGLALALSAGVPAADLSDLYPALSYPVNVIPAKPALPLAPRVPLWARHKTYWRGTPAAVPGAVAMWHGVAPAEAPRKAMFSGWALGERNWRYKGDTGLGITLGSTEARASVLGSPARLGGVAISASSLRAQSDDMNWSMSLALGALDYSGQAASDLAYGPRAANTAMHYGLGSRLSLESALQLAPGLATTGVGARYDAGTWGSLQAGWARGLASGQRGRRYQAAYDIRLFDGVRMSVRSQWDTEGLADLAHYRDGLTGGVRRQWSASVPTRRWGELRGTYETFQPLAGPRTRHVGVSQQFWYSPNLRIGLEAQRDFAGRDYDVGLEFSLPIR